MRVFLLLALLAVHPAIAAPETDPIRPADLMRAGSVPAPSNAPPSIPVHVVNFPNPQNVTGTVAIGNLPTDDTGAILVSSAGSGCQPNALVAELLHEYRLGHDEGFVTEAIDLLPYFGGRILLQLVAHGEQNTNVNVYAHARWTIDENQTIGFDDVAAHVQLIAQTSIDGGADVVVGETRGRFLKIRLAVFGNGATVTVHVMAIK